jgi:exodeoxyribonuclease-3
MKIVSWNVNGLRAVIKHDFIGFIEKYQPDILGLQETKLQEVQIPVAINELMQYQKYWSYAQKKGYSGTALFTKAMPNIVSYSIEDKPVELFGGEGRIICVEYEEFVLYNIYFPNGQMNETRLKYKMQFYEQFLSHAESKRKSGKHIIAMGDFNTAHKEIDLTHPKANSKFSGFLPMEREWLDKFIGYGYIDTFRHFCTAPHNYSWWSYLKNSREKNVGWRIDYVFVNSEFITRVKSAFIWSDVWGSDHCPVGIELC